MTTEIELCDDGYWMPAGHCGRGERYRKRAPKELAPLIRAMPSGRRGLAVQAGGHVGHYPAELARHFERVLTFEPHPANFRAMAANIAAPNVAELMATLTAETTGVGRGVTSRRKNSGGHHVTDSAEYPSVAFALDDLLPLPGLDAIVLDAEGSELSIIRGAQYAIQRYRPWLQIEQRGHIEGKTNDGTTDELIALLESLGYTSHKAVGWDVIWCPA